MALNKLGKDPESPSGGSPTVWLDDEKDTYLVQGCKVLAGERLGQTDIPGHESAVEIPRRMVQSEDAPCLGEDAKWTEHIRRRFGLNDAFATHEVLITGRITLPEA